MEEENKKRPRSEASKCTPKGTPVRKVPVRLRKAKEAGKKAPNNRRSNTSNKGKTQDKEEPKAAEQPENQGDKTSREQDKEAADKEAKVEPITADPGLGPGKYRIFSPLLLLKAKSIEKKRTLGQNPKFLGAL